MISKKKIIEGKNNKICFEEKGNYLLTPESCYKFDKEIFDFSTEK